MDMGKKENIAPRQEYVGWADIESVEYKYPVKKAQKYVLRIALVGSSPRVWREIAVPSNITLTSLAYVIILAMGWEESHLSMFEKGKKEYHVYMDGADMYDYPIEDASDYALCDLLGENEEMLFVYDFGDYWRHTVQLVECAKYGKDEKPTVRLIDGRNACPPNDVGGIGGYKEMLRVIKEDPDGDEAWEYYTWLGSKWDEKFFPAIDTAIAVNEVNYK
jgi:hypothetical protein